MPNRTDQINLVTSLAFRHVVDLVSLHTVVAPPPCQLPFQQALAERAPLLAAYSARRGATPSTIISTHPHPPNLPTASLCGQNSSTAQCSPQTVVRCAQITTFEASTPPSLVIIRKKTAPTSACSAARTISPSPGLVAHALSLSTEVEDFLQVATPPTLQYTDFSSSISHRPSLLNALTSDGEIFSRIVHPYHTAAFNSFLTKHKLYETYPLLVNNLHYGFPLGEMPRLQSTIIFPNNPSSLSHMNEIREYLETEISVCRMSGPFRQEEVERILRGPFQASPLIVSVQPQSPGVPDKIRICRHLSKSSGLGPSINSFIHKEDFPTRFDTASRVADIVSLYAFYHLSPHFRSTLLISLHFVREIILFGRVADWGICRWRYSGLYTPS